MCGLPKFIRCVACVVSIWAPLRFCFQLCNYRNIDIGSYNIAIHWQELIFIYLFIKCKVMNAIFKEQILYKLMFQRGYIYIYIYILDFLVL